MILALLTAFLLLQVDAVHVKKDKYSVGGMHDTKLTKLSSDSAANVKRSSSSNRSYGGSSYSYSSSGYTPSYTYTSTSYGGSSYTPTYSYSYNSIVSN